MCPLLKVSAMDKLVKIADSIKPKSISKDKKLKMAQQQLDTAEVCFVY